VLREHGAGAGALAQAILDGLARDESGALAAMRYQPVEIEPRRIEALTARLTAAGHGPRLDLAGAADAAPVTGLILGNEVLDALPVHRVRGLADGGLEELFVVEAAAAGRAAGATPTFESLAGPPSTADLAARLAAEGIGLRPGQEAEICLALDGWVAGRARELDRGLLLLVDYGHPAPELYDGFKRPRGTLLAYRHHRAVDEPFAAVGRQDLTAHVDVTAVQHAATAAGLVTAGITTQAELLTSLGAGELFAALGRDPATTPEDYLTARSALMRMLDPAAMGKFRVMLFGRGLPADSRLRALEFRLPGR
jgi:SAM-dependent MidA family methyltransferase